MVLFLGDKELIFIKTRILQFVTQMKESQCGTKLLVTPGSKHCVRLGCLDRQKWSLGVGGKGRAGQGRGWLKPSNRDIFNRIL